ncbi:hypothetical protein EXE48_07350 [Halorubrum sp. ASP1]|nr:hypothetical protein EXE48_07350 [Halorubrum sp. ASP1]
MTQRCGRRAPPSARQGARCACEGRGDRSEATGAARLGRREGAVRGGTQRGSRGTKDGAVSTAATERATRATERGAQRAARVLTAGALEEFVAAA